VTGLAGLVCGLGYTLSAGQRLAIIGHHPRTGVMQAQSTGSMAGTNQEPSSVLMLKVRRLKRNLQKKKLLSLAAFELTFCGLNMLMSSKVIDMKGAPKRRDVGKQHTSLITFIFRCSCKVLLSLIINKN
jgi:hypothetical protein